MFRSQASRVSCWKADALRKPVLDFDKWQIDRLRSRFSSMLSDGDAEPRDGVALPEF